MVHFNMAILKVKDFNEFVTMFALKWGVKSYRLIFFLNKNFLENYEAILDRIQKYAHAEEEKKLNKKEKKKDKEGKKQPYEDERENQGSSSEPSQKNPRSQSLPQKFDCYASLSTLRS